MRTNIENHTGLIVSNMAWNSVNVNDTDRQRTERTNKMRHATNQVNEPLSHCTPFIWCICCCSFYELILIVSVRINALMHHTQALIIAIWLTHLHCLRICRVRRKHWNDFFVVTSWHGSFSVFGRISFSMCHCHSLLYFSEIWAANKSLKWKKRSNAICEA